MRETAADLERLQQRLDDSMRSAGEHLARIFDEEHRPTAVEVCERLDGIVEVDLGCVTSDGAPLVAPIDAIFFRGDLWIGIPSPAVRARLVRRDPRVSAAYNHDGFALIVHGTLRPPDDGRAEEHQALVRELYTAQYGPGWLQWFEQLDHSGDVGGYIEPRRIFARRGDAS
jgi:hypothetical protein